MYTEEEKLDNLDTVSDNEKEVVNPEVAKEKNIFDDYVMKTPESEKFVEEKITEPNKPAHWSQRIAGGVIDLCILILCFIGLYTVFTKTSFGNGLREQYDQIVEVLDYYKLVPLVEGSDETCGYKLYDNESSYDNAEYKNLRVYTETDTGAHYKVVEYEGITDELKAAYGKAVTNNEKYKSATFNYRLIDFGFMALAVGIGEVVFMIVVPLTNKRRATIGKLAAGTQLINSKYQVEARWYQVIWRTIWTYGFEIILPLLFLNPAYLVVLIVPPVLFLITFTNKDKRTLHDLVSRTEVIDKRTFVTLNEQE